MLEANDALSSPPLADVETWKAHIHIVSMLSISENLHQGPKWTWFKDKSAAQMPPRFTSLYLQQNASTQSGTWHSPTMQTYDHMQTYATQDLKYRTHIQALMNIENLQQPAVQCVNPTPPPPSAINKKSEVCHIEVTSASTCSWPSVATVRFSVAQSSVRLAITSRQQSVPMCHKNSHRKES